MKIQMQPSITISDESTTTDEFPQQLKVSNLPANDYEILDSSHLTVSKSYSRKNKQKKINDNKNNNNNNKKSSIDLTKDVNFTEHLLTVEELCANLQTNATSGLSETDAEFRFRRDGRNAFTPPKQTPQWLLFLRELSSGFALLLWFAAIASFVAYAVERVNLDYYIAIVLIAVVTITGSFSYYQQLSSSRVFDSFKNMVPQKTNVIRDGKKKQIPADKLVIGDLVLCQSGDRVPADIRLIRCEGMKVDNSSLTGESDPLTRAPDAGHSAPLEAKNLAFFSTNCVDGSGYGIVIATGDRTVMGGIAQLVSNIKNEKTPIAIEIDRFVKIISVIAVFTGIVFFAIALGLGSTFFQAFIFMIGITVGNVPEGLLPALTVALTLTAKRMAAKNCLVKHIEAVETLGSTTTICTDKTGTLTQNRMTASHCWLGNKIYGITHNKEQVQELMAPIQSCWDAFSLCCRLCSRSEFNEYDYEPDIMKRSCSGDASETAILRFMESVTGSVSEYRRSYPKVAEKPFSSTYKYQYSIHKKPAKTNDNESATDFILAMKGAPERIIKLCSTMLCADGSTVTLNDELIEEFEETYRELGSLGERVIAFCDQEFINFPADYEFNIDDENNFQLKHLRFLGLISLIDPPRPSVPDAVSKCRNAGVKVIMVTGDHPITAQAIAKAVGIFTVSHRRSTRISMPCIDNIVRGNTSSIVVPGDELAELSDEELREILDDCREIVFARTTPQQKLRIVENCQYLGQIVAVTGDGVNDSPALKKANIGVAMGITGSDVSKQAADMILLDDNFASIVLAIEEGRRIFDNMKKTVSYILGGNVTTLYPFLIYVICGIPLPIGTITVLLICLGTDMVPAIALAYESAESDIMNMQPRNPKTDKLVSRELLLRCYLLVGFITTSAGLLAYFVAMMDMGWKPWILWQLRHEWDNKDNDALMDSYGETHSYEQRQKMLVTAQSSYFIGIVVIQWMDVIICKTRRLSLFQHGILNNKVVLGSIVFETALACFFCYTPGLNAVLQVSRVIGRVWLCAIPFFVYLFVFEEIRKLIIRRYPKSFLGRELLA